MDDDVVRELVLPKLERVRRQAGYWMARCPAHDDNEASLSIRVGTDQPVLLKCFADCQRDDIVAAMGLTWADIGKPRAQAKGEWTPRGEAVAVYDYVDENGELLYQVCRTADKQFPARVPDPSRKSGYRWNLTGVRRVLYRLPKLIAGVADGELIYVVEGEKDVQALERAGVVATCPPGGSNEAVWLAAYSAHFEGALVRIIADADKPGRAHARRVAASLSGVAAAVEILEAATGKDASDHLEAGLTLADFLTTVESGDAQPDLAPDLYEFIGTADEPIRWVVEGLLERSDRLIWTSREGMGKSMISRQLAVCAAAGLHPFTGRRLSSGQVRVLVVDAENPLRKSRRHYRLLAEVAQYKGFPVPSGGLRLIHRPEGLSLTDPVEVEWLIERVTAHKPDLLVIGPLYKLHAVDANEETAARAIVRALDAARLKADCALMIEAHSPHGDNLRPIGSSLFMRWPEFGYGMKPAVAAKGQESTRRTVDVIPWRGPRDERAWPKRLRWGGSVREWPWVEVPRDAAPADFYWQQDGEV
jgi:hypothetical protein